MKVRERRGPAPVYFRSAGLCYNQTTGSQVSFAEVLASVQRGVALINQYRNTPPNERSATETKDSVSSNTPTTGEEWIA